MKLREVFRYEIEHRVRSPSTWVYMAILFGLAFSITYAGSPSDEAVHSNAPALLSFVMLIISMFGLPVSAALFGDAAVRDVQAEIDPLLFTSPLRKAEYLGGRFLAALAINAVVLVAIPLGFALPVLMGYPDPAAFGPFRAAAYVQPYLLLLLPNLVFAGAILFTFGVLARQVIPVYLAAIGLFFSYMVTLGPMEDEVGPMLSVLGLHGYHALKELTEYWTAAEQNARLIGFPEPLVWNRVVWLAVAAGVLAVLHHVFRFAHPDGGNRRRKGRRTMVEAESGRPGPVAVPRVAGSFGFRTTARQTLAVARRSLADVVASRWFIVVLLACTGLTMLYGWNVGDTVFDTSTWPVTRLVVGTVLSERIVPIIFLLIALYAGELVWKEREVDEAEMADAAPVPEGVALLGRFLALVALLPMLQAATMVGGILIQALQGYYHFEIGLYLRVVFGLNLAGYVLLAALAMTIHVVVNHKYLGHMIVLLAIVFTRVAGRLGIQHHLLVYGTDPGWTYSDMNGFGPFVWFKLYWAAWALLLGVLAVLFWVRGREPDLRSRLRQAHVRFTGPVARTAGVAMALILALGGFIFYNTNIVNEYRTADERSAPQAEYEKRYGRYVDVPQPTISSAELRVEIHPDESAVDLRGTFRMVNRSGVAIDSVHVFFADPGIQARSVSFGRTAEVVLVDEEVGYRIYALEQSLVPGDSMQLSFDVAFRPHGFPNSGIQTAVGGNGAYFNRAWLPFIGYQPAFELTDDKARESVGLGPRPPMAGPDDPSSDTRQRRFAVRDADLVHVEAIIGTAAEQIAVTPGVLRRTWTENGRRYFHYETEMPTSFGATFFSGRYEVLEDRWRDVSLQIFHHPTHRYNPDRTVRSMKASLEYYTAQFGPYPDSQLRIVEIPRYGGFGRAHPHTIAFTEDYFFSRVKEGEVDQPFFGTAHEIAHQWWGGQVRGAPLRGHGFLSESLANYSAMMVVEKTYGPEAARRVYDFQMDRYLRGRASFSHEVPLLEVEDQPYIAYRKGAIAMYALREHIGEEAVRTALRRYVEKYRDAGPPYPTSLDLYAELRAVTPDSLHSLLSDLFEQITLWDVRADEARVEPVGDGSYRVTLTIEAKKVQSDRIGNETEVPMNNLVEIGVFGPARGGDGPGEPLYLERHRLRSGTQMITVTVRREPGRAAVDPYGKLIQRNAADNRVDVNAVTAAPRGR